MNAGDGEVHVIPTITHGRMLVREARAAAARGLLIGCHGYKENAAIQMARLAAIPDSSRWTLVSLQALHRFYRGRSEEVVASWMTREDRDLSIADNISYVDAALEAVPHDESTRIVYAGFSQGVPMAFRAALRGRRGAAGVIAIGGDVPPELLADRDLRFPPVLVARGTRDDWFTQPKFDADVASLTARGAAVQALVYEGGHEWNDAASSAAGEFLAAL
jgi:predicted esterase